MAQELSKQNLPLRRSSSGENNSTAQRARQRTKALQWSIGVVEEKVRKTCALGVHVPVRFAARTKSMRIEKYVIAVRAHARHHPDFQAHGKKLATFLWRYSPR